MLTRPWIPASALLAASIWASAGFPQTSGRISGQVLDSAGGILIGATVTVRQPASGVEFLSTTSNSGHYWAAGLPIGVYTVEARKAGFERSARDGVSVQTAGTTRLNFTLSPEQRTDAVEVKAQVFDPSPQDSRNGVVVAGKDLSELPINGRDYVRLSFLAPGAVVRSNQLADLTFNGMHSTHNQFTIDGIDASRVDQPYVANGAERGARLLTGSLDSIAEFRVETGNYSAEYGKAAGAYINIATKSGSNDVHGAAFEYLRNNRLDARNFFNAKPAGEVPFRYNDFGANVSGPLRRNSTFFFANYEGSRQSIGVLGSGTVPSMRMREAVLATSPALAPILAEMPGGTKATSNELVDSYSVQQGLRIREDTGSVKLTRRFGAGNAGSIRLNSNDSRVKGPLFGTQSGALGLLDRQDVPVRTTNLALFDQHASGSRLTNQFLAGMQRVCTGSATDYAHEPLVIVTGLTIQPGNRGRSESAQTRYQAGDSVHLVAASNLFKAGATVWHTRSAQLTAPGTILSYTSLSDFVANRAASATLTAGNPGSEARAFETGVFVEDTWVVRPALTVTYGLRWDYFAPPYDPQGRAATFDSRTHRLAEPGSAYFSPNRRNFGPRVGVAWALGPKITARGGYGVFYGAFPIGYAGDPARNTLPGNTTILAQLAPNLSYPLVPLLRDAGTAAKPSVAGFLWKKPDLYAEHWSVEAEWNPKGGAVFSAGYIGNHGVHLSRTLNINLLDPRAGQRPLTDYATVSLLTPTGNNLYHGLRISASQSYRTFRGALSYFWSHALDDVADPAVYGSTQPQDDANLRAERGNASGDVRHQLSYSAVWNLSPGRSKALRDWQVASMGFLRTGIPQTVLIGANTFGNGNLVNQRPDAVVGISPYPEQRGPDLWLKAAAFSIPATGRFGNLGRNTVFGPSFADTDISLTKTIWLSETVALRVRAQTFNIFNHPAWAQPANTLGTVTFGKVLSTLGNTIGAGTARQVQLATEIRF